MKKILFLLLIIPLLSACSNPSADNNKDLLISAASSLTDVMEVAEKEFQKTHPDVEVTFNFGSSGNLRNQIQQGAPVDLFLSASKMDMDILTKENLVPKDGVRNFAGNRLVLASTRQLPEKDPAELLLSSAGVIAVGEPESVPVGSYTKSALDELGLWNQLEGNMIFAKDARQVLSYIESGNAEMGIIYSSDADRSPSLSGIVDLPQGEVEIVYPAGITAQAKNKRAAELFLAFLISDEGQKLLTDYGFAAVKGD